MNFLTGVFYAGERGGVRGGKGGRSGWGVGVGEALPTEVILQRSIFNSRDVEIYTVVVIEETKC